jgi:hypothetical protein
MMQTPHDPLEAAKHNLEASTKFIHQIHDWLHNTMDEYSKFIAHLETTLHQEGGNSLKNKETMQHVLTSLNFRLAQLRHLFIEVDAMLKNPAFNFEENGHVLHNWSAHAAHAHRLVSNTVNDLAQRLFSPHQTHRSSSQPASDD